jgi:hypothetical protein
MRGKNGAAPLVGCDGLGGTSEPDAAAHDAAVDVFAEVMGLKRALVQGERVFEVSG